jgi:hypothetical protein
VKRLLKGEAYRPTGYGITKLTVYRKRLKARLINNKFRRKTKAQTVNKPIKLEEKL